MKLDDAISIINSYINSGYTNKYHLPLNIIEAIEKIGNVAIKCESLEKYNDLLKKEVDILARRLAHQLSIPISSVKGQVLFEIEESEKQ